jgi:hypothetical protein
VLTVQDLELRFLQYERPRQYDVLVTGVIGLFILRLEGVKEKEDS